MENVERVVELLREAGIDARVTHGRSYKGGLRGTFSYRDNARTGPIPAVWIVRSEDQPAARAILRDAGLLDSTRHETGFALPPFRTETLALAGAPARKRAFGLKIGLLFVIALVIVLGFLSVGSRKATSPTAAGGLPAGDARTPDALAVAVLAGELPTRAGQSVCLSVDGGDPSSQLLSALTASPATVLRASQCSRRTDMQMLLVGPYRPMHSGAGTIGLQRRRGTTTLSLRTYDVRPEAGGWRVIEPYP